MTADAERYPHVQEWELEVIATYGEHLTNTGGNDPADLINDLTANRNMMTTNVVRFTLAVAVQSQVALIARLLSANLLGKPSSTE